MEQLVASVAVLASCRAKLYKMEQLVVSVAVLASCRAKLYKIKPFVASIAVAAGFKVTDNFRKSSWFFFSVILLL